MTKFFNIIPKLFKTNVSFVFGNIVIDGPLSGKHEALTTDIISRIIKKGMIIVDIEGIEVIAFEELKESLNKTKILIINYSMKT